MYHSMGDFAQLRELPRASKLGHVTVFGELSGLGVFVDMMGLSFFIHNIVLSIGRNHVQARHQPHVVKRDLGIAYAFAAVVYCLLGAVPAAAFEIGKHALPQYTDCAWRTKVLTCDVLPQNVLLAFETAGGHAARACLTLQIAVVYPILGTCMRKQFFGALGHEWPGWGPAMLFNVLIVCFTGTVAAAFPKPGTVVGYVGAYTAIVYMLGLPISTYLSARRKMGDLSCFSGLLHVALMLLMSALVLLQFFV